MLLLLALFAASVTIPDIDGVPRTPLAPAGRASVLFFVTNDCPVSNSYAPEIQRICSDYTPKGVSCNLIYVDPDLKIADVKKHLSEFHYSGLPAMLDAAHKLARATGATVTPEAAVVSPRGEVLYHGRIDNVYASLGVRRTAATAHDLRRALDQTLAGKMVTTPVTKAIGCYIPAMR